MTAAEQEKAEILVFAPLGRDAELVCGMLDRAGLVCKRGHDLRNLDAEALERLATLILTEELLTAATIAMLTSMLDTQPTWSSLPVAVLVDPDSRQVRKRHEALIETFNAQPGVLILQRPMYAASFVSVIRSAVATRQRQFELREQLAAREKAEAHARLLAEEMAHRVKNLLAVAGSIAGQTFRHAKTLDNALRDFSARLAAMARAQDLLTSDGQTSAELGALVHQALKPYRSGEEWGPFEFDGPQVRVSARMATAFAMAFHELATNSVKYGALSAAPGRVDLRWHLDEDSSGATLLQVIWRERQGPPVKPPERRGFGSLLVEQALVHELGGTAEIKFDPEGVICTIRARIDGANERVSV